MNQKLHNDGDFVIFNVQAWLERHKSWGEWIQIGYTGKSTYAGQEFDHSRIPDRSLPGGGQGSMREPFATFTASGECWQQTGIHGTFDRAVAEELVSILRKHDPTLRLRITEMRISQRIRVVAEVGP